MTVPSYDELAADNARLRRELDRAEAALLEAARLKTLGGAPAVYTDRWLNVVQPVGEEL